jgi:hypothetical protein
LATQKLLIIRGTKFFTIVPLDEIIPANLIPHIAFDELSNRGKTEVVEVDVPVPETLAALHEDYVPEIQKLLTRLGRIVFANGKRLTLIDTAGNISRIASLLQQIEKAGGSDPKRPLPIPKKIPFKMQNVPWSEVLAWYAKESGLAAGYVPRIEGQFSFVPRDGRELNITEITDIVNEGLMQKHYLLIRKTISFTVVPSDEKIDPILATPTKIDELMDRGNTQLVEVIIPLPLKEKASEKAAKLYSQKMLSEFSSVSWVTGPNSSSLIVIDIASSVRKLVQAINEPGDADPRMNKEPGDADPRKKKDAQEKKFPFKMKDVPWDEVLERFSEISGLVRTTTTKPKGNFTFQPPTPETQYTLAEITDIINEALSAQNFVLIRRQVSFFIHPTNEKLDYISSPRTELSDLETLGKTEIVQVLIPLTKLKAAEVAPEIKKMLSPFGEISCLEKTNTLFLMDSAGNLRRVVRLIQELDAGDAGKKSPEKK